MIRVVQWETAEIGAYACRTVLDHPELELVGAFVGSVERAGRDVGELVAIDGYPTVPPVGIAATADRDDILAMDADCVVHCPPQEHEPTQAVDDICELLASGKSVSSTALMHLIHPNGMPETTRRRIEEACAEGKSTFHGNGINPGYFFEVLPVMLSSVSTDIRHVVCTEFHSYAGNPDKWIVVDLVGMGSSMEDRKAKVEGSNPPFARAPLGLLAEGVGLQLDDVTFDYELCAAEDDFEIAAGKVAAGTFAGIWCRFGGIVDGVERLRLEFIQRAAPHVAPQWPAAPAVPTCWRVEIDGVPRVVNDTVLSVDHGLPTYAGAGIQAANAVPAVCASPAGIATRLDLRPFGGRALQPGDASHWRGGWS